MLVGPGILGLALVFSLLVNFPLSLSTWVVGRLMVIWALDSCAQFLAVAEHRLIPSRARSVCHQLRKAGYQSVWSPACQDQVAGGHAGVGVVSLAGAPLALPCIVTLHFKEFSSG